MSQLFQPFSLGPLQLENRIVIPPMCQYAAKEGVPGAWHAMHLGQMATSGAGLFILEATAVVPEGRITPGDLGLYSQASEEALGGLLEGLRSYSQMPLALQLAHAGRKASCALPWEGGAQLGREQGGWETFGPSALAYGAGDRPPTALDTEGLARVRQAFADAAKRAARLGFDALEVHSAHGYLLHSFLSPISNQRRDAYGGSLENRLRFPLEVFEAVRAAFPSDRPVGVRFSATDWVEGGWEVEQSLVYARALQERACAFLHVSSGGLDPRQQLQPYPGYQLGLARRMKQALDLPVIAVGLITEPAQAEEVLTSGQADLVAIGRNLLYNPHWPWHAAAALGAKLRVPPQYLRSAPAGQAGLFQ